MQAAPARFIVAEEDHRLRLDRYLRKVRPDLSRQAIDGLLRTGAVSIRGKARGPGTFVKRGDEVELRPALAVGPATPGLLLRTPHLAAVGKPPGLATNPAGRTADRLLRWLGEALSSDPPAHPPGIVHRLDRDTSGVVLFSLTPEGHRLMLEAFTEARLRRTYLGLVPGSMHPRRGTIDLPLTRDTGGRMRPAPRGARARTRYETLRTGSGASLLRLRPETGRMHQIRAHLAAVGHPLLADPIYGAPHARLDAPRLWLHAWRIDLDVPLAAALGSPERIVCPLWEDLAAHLAGLAIDYDFNRA